jgi:hypothetical protein
MDLDLYQPDNSGSNYFDCFQKNLSVTLIARKYSDSQKSNFDIYLPNWLAKYNKEIYTVIVLIAVVILIYRLLT